MIRRRLRLLASLLVAFSLAIGAVALHAQAWSATAGIAAVANSGEAVANADEAADDGLCHGDDGGQTGPLIPGERLPLCCVAHSGAPPPAPSAPTRGTLPVAQPYALARQASPSPLFVLPDPRPPRA